MAGRKPLNSAIFMKARTQIILRANHVDVENRSEIVRLIELIEAHKADGTLNKFVLNALMNQMRSDEQGTHAPLSITPQVQSEAQSEPQAARVLSDITPRVTVAPASSTTGSTPAAHVNDERFGQGVFVAAPVQVETAPSLEPSSMADFAVENSTASQTPEMVIESTLRSLENQGGASAGEMQPRPKRRMGRDALSAMG
ncbi:hypothetical protein ACEN2T_17645 [Pseudomonas sp. W22_MBD1_FP4]|uniref:hypothetical protein n=1 Tax=Pseudomonas sp. W22_MBD1_FP4 TaxID=3240272 RepID=UPI003F9E15E4